VAELRALQLLAVRGDDRDDCDADAEHDPEDRDQQCDEASFISFISMLPSGAEQNSHDCPDRLERRADPVSREEGGDCRERAFERPRLRRRTLSLPLHAS
jgi:hypothetical protein